MAAVLESIEEELRVAMAPTAVTQKAALVHKPHMLGRLRVELVGGRSAATGIYARSPLKFLVPNHVAADGVDAVWVYSLSYGGGIVAGDKIDFEVDIGAGCTAVLTTQASTKVYHSHEGVGAQQAIEASVGSGALLALLPDPVVCFARSSFVQSQTFRLAKNASLVLVDWLTCGRRQFGGEVWAFDSYESSNRIFLEGSSPLLLDKVRLEQGHGPSVAERMHGFHIIGLVVLYGERTAELRATMEPNIQSAAQAFLRNGSKRAAKTAAAASGSGREDQQGQPLVASCSRIGDEGEGLVVRLAATSTEVAHNFLQEQLAPLSHVIGAVPYPAIF